MCKPTEHNFEHGGEATGTYDTWLFCTKCGATELIPNTAEEPGIIIPPAVRS